MATWIRLPSRQAEFVSSSEDASSPLPGPRRSYRRAKDLVCAASRDLRAPLHSIQLLVDGLREHQTDILLAQATLHDALGRMSRLTQQAITTVEDLLSIEKLEEESALENRPTSRLDVEDALKEAVTRQGEMLAMAGCQVLVTHDGTPQGEPGAWNRESLVRVFVNMLGSAARRAPGTEVRFQLTEHGAWLRVEVAEEGPGLSDGEAEGWLGGSHFSAGARDGRYGLELWVASHGVIALGGEMDVQSWPGAGVRFDIRLPLGASLR
jgi:signal transduction histidine kinase